MNNNTKKIMNYFLVNVADIVNGKYCVGAEREKTLIKTNDFLKNCFDEKDYELKTLDDICDGIGIDKNNKGKRQSLSILLLRYVTSGIVDSERNFIERNVLRVENRNKVFYAYNPKHVKKLEKLARKEDKVTCWGDQYKDYGAVEFNRMAKALKKNKDMIKEEFELKKKKFHKGIAWKELTADEFIELSNKIIANGLGQYDVFFKKYQEVCLRIRRPTD